MKNTSFAMLLLVGVLAGCSSSEGDQGEGGGGGDGAGASALVCDPDAGEADPCRIPCDPEDEDACPGEWPDYYGCKVANPDCSPRDTPLCEPIPLECAHTFGGTACGCDGQIGDAVCIELGSNRVAADPAFCGGEDFACGEGTCRSVVEACRTVVDEAGEEIEHACVIAAESGCGDFGVADCYCLGGNATGFPEGTTCERDAAGEVRIVAAR